MSQSVTSASFRLASAILAFSLSSCTRPPPPSNVGSPLHENHEDPAPASEMSLEEAQGVIKEIQQRFGANAPPPAAPPTSIVEVLSIIEADEVHRFPAASDFASGLAGPDALAVRALVELQWAGMYRLGQAVYEELIQVSSREASLLQGKKDRGEQLTDTQARRLDDLTKEVEWMRRARSALVALAKPRVEEGGKLAQEAVRQNSTKAEGHLASAFHHRLTKDWLAYDRAVTEFERTKQRDYVLAEYLRALEHLERGGSEVRAREAMADVIARAPKFVRAQAHMVLLQDDIEDTYHELQRLREVAPRHPVVNLTGGPITQVYETSMAIRGATGG